jgi:hypothetical protein
MDRFSGYVTAKKEMAETLRAVVASGSVTVPQIREQLAAAVRKILDAGVAAGTLRADVRAEDIVVTVVGMFSAISLAGGDEQLQRMLNLLMDAVRLPVRHRPPVEPGLCADCAYASVKDTRRGTTYLRCTRASWDSSLVRYPACRSPRAPASPGRRSRPTARWPGKPRRGAGRGGPRSRGSARP